jgi:hypothetical protein
VLHNSICKILVEAGTSLCGEHQSSHRFELGGDLQEIDKVATCHFRRIDHFPLLFLSLFVFPRPGRVKRLQPGHLDPLTLPASPSTHGLVCPPFFRAWPTRRRSTTTLPHVSPILQPYASLASRCSFASSPGRNHTTLPHRPSCPMATPWTSTPPR